MDAAAATRFIMIGMPVVARGMPIIAFATPVIVLDAPAAPVVAIPAARVITLDALATRLVAFGVPATWFVAAADATRLVALDAPATGFVAVAAATRFVALDALATGFVAVADATRFAALDALATGLVAAAEATRFVALDALATRFLALGAKTTRLVTLGAEATRFITLDAPAAWVDMVATLWFGTNVVRLSRRVVFIGTLRYVSSASDQSLDPIESLTKLALDTIKLTAKRLDLTLQSGGRQFCVGLFLARTSPRQRAHQQRGREYHLGQSS
jgi:hypothetical protein